MLQTVRHTLAELGEVEYVVGNMETKNHLRSSTTTALNAVLITGGDNSAVCRFGASSYIQIYGRPVTHQVANAKDLQAVLGLDASSPTIEQ
ncbi:hypothetical protein BGZ99_007067 [Dissophora globulifera]|uniref:Uncharacterized protein n=1 Tax=Dissophora globulifera TaxID=979702 RepID=A0A9P6RVA5_9FUNG|nr:hypothetical protein BGZ99_007067 [Dissophora globulifera]